MRLVKTIKIIVFLPVFIASWYFLRDYFAPDACLDFGGSFDYINWKCNYDVTLKYIEIPFYKIKTFWLVPFSLVFSLSVFAHINK